MKHIIDGMDATKEFIFKGFMCFRCTFKAFGVILWHFKVFQINQRVFFSFLFFFFKFKKKILFRGANYRAPWRDFTGALAPIKSEGLKLRSW
jgi:hypothetical protein